MDVKEEEILLNELKDDTETYNISLYENKELEILKKAIQIAQEKQGKRITKNPIIKKIISILEKFISKKGLVCYGGTAINNILPEKDQFYNKELELPDYDCFSSNAMDDAVELADIYFKEGFTDVEAKAGVHFGTYKVYVNFIAIADITQMESSLFKNIKKQAIEKNDILYSPPNFLRMAMYLELSRPGGNVERWEKVLKRLILLNKNYPLKAFNCENDNTIRKNNEEKTHNSLYSESLDYNEIHKIIKNEAIREKLVFFGSYANMLYSKYLKDSAKTYLSEIPDFDLLSVEPYETAKNIKNALENEGFKNIKINKKKPIGEYVGEHYEIKILNKSIAYIYKPIGCYSYNVVKIGNNFVRVATIDSMLSFYLIFLYANRPYYDSNRILCMCQYLFEIQQKNRLKQHGLLRRFSVSCYGVQRTIEDIRNEKAIKFKELKNNRNTRKYKEWFLRYIPFEKIVLTNKEKKIEKEIPEYITPFKPHLSKPLSVRSIHVNKTIRKMYSNLSKSKKSINGILSSNKTKKHKK